MYQIIHSLTGYHSVLFSIFTEWCNHHHNLFQNTSPISTVLNNHESNFCLYRLLILDISYAWSHIICGPLYLPSFTSHKVFKVHLCCSMYQYFITFYGQIIFHWKGIPHFVYLFICWCIFDVILLWTFMYKFLCGHMFSFFLDLYLGVDLLGQMITLCLNFWRSARLLSIVAALFCIPTCSIWGFWVFHILVNTC